MLHSDVQNTLPTLNKLTLNMYKFLLVLKSLLIIYLLLMIALYLLQRKMIYKPTPYVDHNFETFQFTHQEHTSEALLTNPSKEQVIIYFGGNAENIIYSATDLEKHFPDHSSYLLKYRGYAGAKGKPTEKNLYADALALYDEVSRKYNHITVIGKSLGSGVATYVASERNVDKLVLVTPFDSIRAIAKGLFPFFPIKWLIKDPHDSKSRVSKIKAPTLVIIADEDRVVPLARTQSLLESLSKANLEIVTLNAGHNGLDLVSGYFSSIQQFLNYPQDTDNS